VVRGRRDGRWVLGRWITLTLSPAPARPGVTTYQAHQISGTPQPHRVREEDYRHNYMECGHNPLPHCRHNKNEKAPPTTGVQKVCPLSLSRLQASSSLIRTFVSRECSFFERVVEGDAKPPPLRSLPKYRRENQALLGPVCPW